MAGVNIVHLIGNVGNDPEIRQVNGKTVANFNLATSESYNSNGEKKTVTEWHRVQVWDKLGDIVQQFVKKGSQVYIGGKIKYEQYTDKDGQQKQATKIIANSLQLIGGKPQDSQSAKEDKAVQVEGAKVVVTTVEQVTVPDSEIDDLPF